jgi:hypothetical protein
VHQLEIPTSLEAGLKDNLKVHFFWERFTKSMFLRGTTQENLFNDPIWAKECNKPSSTFSKVKLSSIKAEPLKT